MAHVEKDLIDTFGVVSGECAKQMAQNTRLYRVTIVFLLQEMQVQMQWKINRQVVFFVLSHQKMQ